MSLEFFVWAFTSIGIYYLLACGLNVQYGIAGVLNLGVHGMFAVAAYSYGMLTQPTDSLTALAFSLPWSVAALLAVLSAALLSVILIGPALFINPRGRSQYLIPIITLAAAETIYVVFSLNQNLAGGFAGLYNVPAPFSELLTQTDSTRFAWQYLGLITILCLIVTAISSLFRNSRFGLLLRGSRDDEIEMSTLGYFPPYIRLVAVAYGGALMGIAGVCWAGYLGTLQPSAFTIRETLLVLIAVIAGGRGSIKGCVVGSLLVFGLLDQGTRILPAAWLTYLPALPLILIGVVLIVLLRYRSTGLLPERPRRYVRELDALSSNSGEGFNWPRSRIKDE